MSAHPMKILVTPRSLTRGGHPALERIKQAGYDIVFSTPGTLPTEAELLELLPGCVGYLAGVEPVSATVLDAAADLKVISRNGTGVDKVDLAAAERNGIKVCRAEGANARGVAELAIACVLSLIRSLPFSDGRMKAETWERRKGVELEDRTLGLVGCGRIGRLVARMALAFDMKILAHDPCPDESFQPSASFSYVPIEELLRRSDIISLHCPALEDGRALVDKDAFARMKDGAYLVNTARGSLIDAAAAMAALDSGKLAGLALDAFDTEPPADWRLVKHPRVIATPHLGGFTAESVDRAVSAAVDHLLTALQTC